MSEGVLVVRDIRIVNEVEEQSVYYLAAHGLMQEFMGVLDLGEEEDGQICRPARNEILAYYPHMSADQLREEAGETHDRWADPEETQERLN